MSNGKNTQRPSRRSLSVGWIEEKFDVVDEENHMEESMTCSVELRDRKWNPKIACEGGWRLPRDKIECRNKEQNKNTKQRWTKKAQTPMIGCHNQRTGATKKNPPAWSEKRESQKTTCALQVHFLS